MILPKLYIQRMNQGSRWPSECTGVGFTPHKPQHCIWVWWSLAQFHLSARKPTPNKHILNELGNLASDEAMLCTYHIWDSGGCWFYILHIHVGAFADIGTRVCPVAIWWLFVASYIRTLSDLCRQVHVCLKVESMCMHTRYTYSYVTLWLF